MTTAQAIIDAAERLLRDRPLHRLGVAEIAAEAGLSRSGFYLHFHSKSDVTARALTQVMDEVAVAFAPLHARDGDDLELTIRASLERWVLVCERHGALLRTVSEEWPHDERLRRLWLELMHRVAAGTAAVIREARAAGQAPEGADGDELAACLTWGCERVLHVSLAGGAEGLPGPKALVEPLAQIMLGGVFGRAPGA